MICAEWPPGKDPTEPGSTKYDESEDLVCPDSNCSDPRDSFCCGCTLNICEVTNSKDGIGGCSYSKKTNYWWVWLIVVLVILVACCFLLVAVLYWYLGSSPKHVDQGAVPTYYYDHERGTSRGGSRRNIGAGRSRGTSRKRLDKDGPSAEAMAAATIAEMKSEDGTVLVTPGGETVQLAKPPGGEEVLVVKTEETVVTTTTVGKVEDKAADDEESSESN